MRTIVFVIITSLLSFGAAYPQGWEQLYPQNTVGPLYDIVFMNPTHGVAVGDSGLILRTEDGGQNWGEVVSGTDYRLSHVDAAGEDLLWIYGSGPFPSYPNYQILHSDDGGQTWAIQSQGTDSAVSSFDFIDANTGWAVGYQGSIMKTTDGGESWQPQTSGVTVGLNGVYFLDENEGWAVGGIEILHTSNGGQTWTLQGDSLHGTLNGVFFTDENHGWATSGYETMWNGTYGTTSYTADGGNTWRVYEDERLIFAGRDIFFSSVDNGWITGYWNTGEGMWLGGTYLLHTNDGGATWSEYLSSQMSITSIMFLDEDSGWIIGNNSVLSTINGGESWDGQLATNENLTSVCFLDTLTGWALGEAGGILHTIDGGLNWDLRYDGDIEKLNVIEFITPSLGWIGGNEGAVLRTIDGGASWTRCALPDTAESHVLNMICMDFLSEDTGWITTNPRTPGGGIPGNTQSYVYRTVDGGESWTLLNSDYYSISSISFVDEDWGWMVSNHVLFQDTIRHSTDGGVTWVNQASGVADNLNEICFIDRSHGWAVGGEGTIMATNDGGETWIEQTSGTNAWLTTIRFSDSGQGWAFGYDNEIYEYVLLRTTDGGDNWSSQSFSRHGIEINYVAFMDSTHGWAVGDYGKIFKYDPDAEAFEPRSIILPISYNLSCYPNPFNPSTTIAYDLPNAGHISLRVFDLLGRGVAVLKDGFTEAGTHHVTFDGSNLASGIYFARLDVGTFSQTKKLMLIK